jgi:hypothetical protein
MNLKAKIQAAASRAANGPGDPKDKNNNPVPPKGSYGNKVGKMIGKTAGNPKMQSTLKEVYTTKRTPMSSMPTLKPTSVSVSAEKRTAAPLAGKAPVGNTKRRG